MGRRHLRCREGGEVARLARPAVQPNRRSRGAPPGQWRTRRDLPGRTRQGDQHRALDIVDGQIQTIRTVQNPDKLRHVGPVPTGGRWSARRSKPTDRRTERVSARWRVSRLSGIRLLPHAEFLQRNQLTPDQHCRSGAGYRRRSCPAMRSRGRQWKKLMSCGLVSSSTRRRTRSWPGRPAAGVPSTRSSTKAAKRGTRRCRVPGSRACSVMARERSMLLARSSSSAGAPPAGRAAHVPPRRGGRRSAPATCRPPGSSG